MPVVSTEYLPLFKIFLSAGQLLQLLWSAVIGGGVLLSLLIFLQAQRYQDLVRLRSARELLAWSLPSKLFGLLFWSLAVLNLFAVHTLYRPPFFASLFWVGTLVMLATALLLLFLYRQLINRPQPGTVVPVMIGAVGLGLLLGTFLLFTSGGAALLKPEYWPHLNHNPLLFLSWNGLARFLLFLSLALQLTGVVLSLRSDGTLCPEPETGYHHYLGRRGVWLALLGALLLPPGLVFELLTLPVLARSLATFLLPTISLLVALLLCLALCRRLLDRQGSNGKSQLAAVLFIFLLVGLGDHLTREQVLADGIAPWRQTSSVDPVALTAATPAKEQLARGEQIFQERCALCHRFDSRLVGPPLNEVLPSYRGRFEALQQFIRQPVKRNPDYPAMPNLGLQQEEASAVAAYLLQRPEED
jgi:mono/diheme cytochrome c family protein